MLFADVKHAHYGNPNTDQLQYVDKMEQHQVQVDNTECFRAIVEYSP